jgi:hypothetical protein
VDNKEMTCIGAGFWLGLRSVSRYFGHSKEYLGSSKGGNFFTCSVSKCNNTIPYNPLIYERMTKCSTPCSFLTILASYFTTFFYAENQFIFTAYICNSTHLHSLSGVLNNQHVCLLFDTQFNVVSSFPKGVMNPSVLTARGSSGQVPVNVLYTPDSRYI